MPTIRLEEDVFEALKKLAEPFVDTPSTVVRRLLEEKGVLAKRQASARPMARAAPRAGEVGGQALTSQAIYETFLLYVLKRQFAGKGHKRDVTHAIVQLMQNRGLLGSADLELVSTGETKAENTISWARNALKERGLIARSSPRGIWELTPPGHATAAEVTLPRRA